MKITTVDTTTAPWFTASTAGEREKRRQRSRPRERSSPMPMSQLILLGIVAMAGLATLRVVRFRRGLTPLPDIRGKRFALFAFVVVPPVVFGGIGALPMYVAIIAGLAI